MNAYELAKELSEFMTEDSYTELDKSIFKTVNMLRQQADRIAKLEKGLEERIKHSLCSTPISIQSRVYVDDKEVSNLRMTYEEAKLTPQTKPLSDEEIIQVRQTTKANNTDNWADSLAFARAIEERILGK